MRVCGVEVIKPDLIARLHARFQRAVPQLWIDAFIALLLVVALYLLDKFLD
jgi:hypothetical protein